MGYAICRIEKVKSSKELSDRYNHNMRIFDVHNADPLLSSQNVELVDQLHGRSYEDIYTDTIRHLQMTGAITKEVRKDAVKGFEVLLCFSHEDAAGINLNEWANRSVEWLREQFNPPGGMISYTNKDGQKITEPVDNVKSVVLHMDEATPHIHAFIVPIDEHGHLNAKSYTNGRGAMSRLQDAYAKAMEPFGLWRGERHSKASPAQRSAYYNRLLQAVESSLPEPLPGESVQDYYKRADDVHKTAMVHQRDDVVKAERKIAKKESALFDRTVDVTGREAKLIEERYHYEMEHGKKEILLDKLADTIGEPDLSEGSLKRVGRDVAELKAFKEALENHPDRKKAMSVKCSYNEMLNWQKRHKIRQKKQEFEKN